MKKISFIVLLIFFLNNSQAQVSHGGQPLPLSQTKSLTTNLFYDMPPFDLDEELRLNEQNESDLRGGYIFAYKFMTHLNRNNSGVSFMLPDGTQVWRLGIRSQGALSINILFTEYELPEGAQVFLYNPLQTQVLGAFSSLNNSELGILPVSPLYGDEIIIEYREPGNTPFPGRLTVGEVNHGYRNFKGYEPAGDRSEFYCMPSPICFQEGDEYDLMARSTVLITIDGITACTGVMLNNTSNDGKPYLLTASHCLNKNFSVENPDYETVAGSIVCFFNYSSPTCDTIMRGTEEMSVASARFRAVNEKIDMALLELVETPPVYYRPYYAGWNTEEQGEKPPYTGIHHPRAAVKRVGVSEENIKLKTFSISAMEFYKNAHWHVETWATGSTASGSSGSPLFDSDSRVIGALSGGNSYCTDPSDDFYYALSKAWEPEVEKEMQLKHWLDPSNSNSLTLGGLDPYASGPCYRLSNIYDVKLQDSIDVSSLASPASGSLFGTNSLKTNEYLEEYNANGNISIYGVYIVTPSITDAAGSLDVEIRVYSGDNKPQTLIHTEKFNPTYTDYFRTDSSFQETEKKLNREQEHFIHFENPVEVSGSFFIGYKINNPQNSTFAVYNLPKGETAKNTSWIFLNNKWTPTPEHPSAAFSTSLFIDPVIQYINKPSNEKSQQPHAPVQVFFNTNSKMIHILSSEKLNNGICTLYMINGAEVLKKPIIDRYTTIPAGNLNPGIYLINITGENFSYTQKAIF